MEKFEKYQCYYKYECAVALLFKCYHFYHYNEQSMLIYFRPHVLIHFMYIYQKNGHTTLSPKFLHHPNINYNYT